VAASYDADRRKERHWWFEDDFVRDYFRRDPVGSLLDLPVGTGRFFPCYRGVQRLTGVDISEAMLAEAAKRVSGLDPTTQVTLEVGDVTALKYADNTFDAAIIWRLLHLFSADALPAVIGELSRVTRGPLIVQKFTLRVAGTTAAFVMGMTLSTRTKISSSGCMPARRKRS
jgi:ubiquinone/menaquinone biosynthesis C-methylase UbiE